MIIEQLGQRERRVLALGLLVAVVLACLLLVVQPLAGAYSGYRAEIADERFRLERLRRWRRCLPELEREVEILRTRVADSGLFIGARPGTSPLRIYSSAWRGLSIVTVAASIRCR
ncbi:MAG: hypothetical protein U5L11_00425 [Arhodomonas sp.]|nr:hypothetical protein [Arhodomonas sp.]